MRPCVFEWCGKPAKVLPNEMKRGTKEPFFCSMKHAAWWALAHVFDVEEWCEEGRHYTCPESSCEHGPVEAEGR